MYLHKMRGKSEGNETVLFLLRCDNNKSDKEYKNNNDFRLEINRNSLYIPHIVIYIYMFVCM